MCGIFGYLGVPQPLDDQVMTGLRTLEYRGYDSWGVALWDTTGFRVTKQVGKIGQATLTGTMAPTTLGIGHTRWATHGGVTPENAHPHLDCHGTLAVVHNGILENWRELKENLEQSGHAFLSQTDTEVLAHFFEDVSLHDVAALRERLLALRGQNAVVVASGQERALFAYRSGSPLTAAITPQGTYIASDPLALAPYSSQVVFVPNDALLLVTTDGIRLMDVPSGQELTLSPVTLQWADHETALGEDTHFMQKEIAQQARTLREWSEVSEDVLQPLVTLWQQRSHHLLTGCGSSSFVSLYGLHALATIAHERCSVIPANELAPLYPILSSDSCVLAVSQSGESIDVVEHVPHLKQQGCLLGAIVNREHSTLQTQADAAVLLNVGPEQAVVATKSFTATMAVLLLLAAKLGGNMPRARHDLARAADAITEVITPAWQQRYVQPVVERLRGASHAFVLGKGAHWPIALESALKMKEISYIHAEGFAAGELKHGVLALIEPGTPCLLFCPDDETATDMLTAAHEIHARGGSVIGISVAPHDVFDLYIPLAAGGWGTPFLSAVLGQILGYFLTVDRGLDPDKPRNLAKSVTVK